MCIKDRNDTASTTAKGNPHVPRRYAPIPAWVTPKTVSYTHLTLPAGDLVKISVVAVSFNNKNNNHSVYANHTSNNEETHVTYVITSTPS